MAYEIHIPITPARAPEGLGSRLVSAVLSRLSGLRAHPAAERQRSRGSPPVPKRLHSDLGLPEVIEPFRYWDHP